MVERIVLSGQLTVESMQSQLEGATGRLRRAVRPVGLIIDLLEMTGYDPACRTAFTSWYRQNASKIACVAGITEKATWRMIISAIGLATAGRFASFNNEREAAAWVRRIVAPGEAA